MASYVQRTAPAAGGWVVIGTIPGDGSVGTINIRLVNRDQLNQITISLAVSAAAGAPAVADYIEPPALVIPAGGVLEETAVAVAPGEVVQAFTSAATLSTRVHGR